MPITEAPWGDTTRTLHAIPPAALEALQRGDRDGAQVQMPTLVLTDFVVSPLCLRTWRYRHSQLQHQPDDAVWVTRLLALQPDRRVIGRAGFHGAPDEHGMVEIGYEIDPLHQRQGHGMAAIHLMLAAARTDDTVRMVRASVGVANEVSRAMVLRCGFIKVGEEMDEEDGLEEVYERPIILEEGLNSATQGGTGGREDSRH